MTDPTIYKEVMRRYATGVMVLTIRDGDNFHAVTVNSVTSVSLQPILLLVCLEKNARSHELVHQTKTFALNILSGAQIELGKIFAYDRDARSNPYAQGASHPSPRGELLFDDSLGYFECHVTAEYEGGDHTIFMAEVIEASATAPDPSPLIYFESRWSTLAT